MKFAPVDIGVFMIETRSAKRPYVSRTTDKRDELPKIQNIVAPKRSDVASGSMDKTTLKGMIPHKLLTPEVEKSPKVAEISNQAIWKLRFPSLTRHQRKDDTQQFNIVNKLKGTPSKISLFEALKIPRQIDILRVALVAQNEGMDKVLNLFEAFKYLGMGKNKPPTFYMTLEIDEYILHNCLVDSGAAMTIMPKVVYDVMGLPLTRTSMGVLQLESTLVKIVGVIKDVVLKVHKCPSVIITQEIMVVELSPLFGLCLSREFTTKIGGYLAMDYTHYLIPCGDKRVRLDNGKKFDIHVEKKRRS